MVSALPVATKTLLFEGSIAPPPGPHMPPPLGPCVEFPLIVKNAPAMLGPAVLIATILPYHGEMSHVDPVTA